MSDTHDQHLDRIAIIGMAGRFPGAADVAQFWRNLRDGVESIRFFSREELAAIGVEAALLDDPRHVPAFALLEGIEFFDAEFFGISPREAEVTDPQHRVFLECAWEALESSGYNPDRYDGLIGVFAGAGPSTYLLNNLIRRRDLLRSVDAVQLQVGNNKDFVPTRVSYKLNLKGPSVNVNTACSSSLVAVHLACQSLLDHQCDVALAGGVGIQVPQERGYLYLQDGILSPDGHCRAFDADARGTVGGNGVGIVVLKRLGDALADNDSILAVILGSAINNDGAAKVGFTAPSVDGQAAVIAEAQAVAEVEPETIGYIEAHGTGTALGDPIEVAALTQVFGPHARETGFCALGSVKSNIGHLDEAAGIAGLIKTVQALRYRSIPPSLHYARPNPQIDFAHGPFHVNAALSSWEARETPRRAGVSSFGIGGTNAHLVVEEAPAPIAGRNRPSRPWRVLKLSARTATALDAATANLADHLRANPDLDLADVAYTLHVGRKDFPHRRVVICKDVIDAAHALESRDQRRVATARHESSRRQVVFLFPGQGSQHVNMGLELHRTEPAFRAELDRCAEFLAPQIGVDFRTVLYPDSRAVDEMAERLDQTDIAQPALFAVEYALARLWMSWGVQPRAMIGHSLGEYVAACLAGVFSLEDALTLVATRGRLMQQRPAGGMLAVDLTPEELRAELDGELWLAAVNAPSRCVVSGSLPALKSLERDLAARGVACRRLATSHAFHSGMMDLILHPFEQQVRRLDLHAPKIPYLSNVSGRWITAEQATDPGYWAQHLRQTVQLSTGLELLLERPDHVLLEVGPGRLLTTLARLSPRMGPDRLVLNSMRHPRDPQLDAFCLMEAYGRLWLAGACEPSNGPEAGERSRRVPLPTYPFERRRYWIEPPAGRDDEPGEPARDNPPALKSIEDWFYVPTWKRRAQPNGRPREVAAGECWLVFLDPCRLGSRLVERLQSSGARTITVGVGAHFERRSDAEYSIDPRRPEDYDDLIQDLVAGGRSPRRIVHLWNVTEPVMEFVPDLLDGAQDLGFFSLLFLAQAMGKVEVYDSLQLDVISSQAQQVTGGDLLCPEKSTLLGPVRVIPIEYPHIRCRTIDLTPPGSARWDDDRCVDRLVDELCSESLGPVVAIRGDYAWGQTMEPVHLASPSTAPPRLRRGGVYMITGGLGSMGLAFAHYLAREVQAKLILVGRTGLPSPDSHDERRTSGFDLETAGAVVPALESEAEATAELWEIDTDGRFQSLLHSYCSGLICKYFAEGGIDLTEGRTYRPDDLGKQLRVLPKFTRFLNFLLGALAEDGHVHQGADGVEFRGDGALRDLSAVRQEFLERYPEFSGVVRLLEHSTRHYRQALSGENPSISVLYPDGTSKFMDECRRKSPEYGRDPVYLKVAANLLAILREKTAGKTLRLLEVGGGTGGLTFHALGALKDGEVEYHFTDLGRSFVRAAERDASARGLDFMRFGVLDIARDPEPQGYARQSFDVVIGYNVVHATPRVEETIAHLRTLLVPGGVLLLVETTRLKRWDEMVWGLTEGWWHYTDEPLRTTSPLLGLDRWEQILRAQGFSIVRAYPEDDRRRLTIDAGLVVAQLAGERIEQSASDDPPGSQSSGDVLAKVEEIRRLGGEVVVLQADVSDPQQMRAVMSQVQERFGTLHGVIHTAGVLGQELIRTRTAAAASSVLAPKVQGTVVLDALLQEQEVEPDFLVLCSSLASTSPLSGQVDYCAANAFLDAYAAYRSGRGTMAAIAIDWGFWQELGMIEQAAIPSAWKQEIVEEIRARGWTNAGVDAFRCILASCASPQVAVWPEAWEALADLRRAGGDRVGSGRQPEGIRSGSDAGESGPPRTRPVDHPWIETCEVYDADVECCVSNLGPSRHWVLNEHRPLGPATLPGTAFLELAVAAVGDRGRGRAIQLSEVYFLTPLVVGDDETKTVRTILKERDHRFDFVVVSQVRADRDEWLEHARGEIEFLEEPPPRVDLRDWIDRRREHNILLDEDGPPGEPTEFATRVRRFSPRWRNFRQMRLDRREGVASLALPEEFASEAGMYTLHPALLDMATGFMAIADQFEDGAPFSYGRVRIWKPLPKAVHSHARGVEDQQRDEHTYDVTIVDEQGDVVLDVANYTLRAYTGAARDRGSEETRPDTPRADGDNFCVAIDRQGSLGTLGLRTAARRRPKPGEVEIEVEVAGLNFIEVLYALGLLPEPPDGDVRFGLECAGTVASLGEGVADFRPGDRVFGLVAGAFGRFATTPAMAIALQPDHLSPLEAATIPAAYSTAYYALITRGRLRRGERVLIHAATGGVGLAAVTIARWRNAEVFATAGTPEKREYLRNMGIEHVFDSRQLDFAEQVLDATDGRGVDVVLNSLGGDFIPASLSTLARYGRFLELGKRDIFQNTPLSLAPFERHLSFMAIDVGIDLPEFSSIWRKVVREVRRGTYRPLPYRTFPVGRVAEAFEYMAQARHIGKVVVTIGAEAVGTSPSSVKGRPLHAFLGDGISPPVRDARRNGHETPSGPRRLDTAHSRPDLKSTYRAPQGEAEREVAEIWQELLGVSGIGADDNFFELRGDSLLAAQVMSHIHQALGVRLPLSIIFDHPTVAGVAMLIEGLRGSLRELETAPQGAPLAGEVEHTL